MAFRSSLFGAHEVKSKRINKNTSLPEWCHHETQSTSHILNLCEHFGLALTYSLVAPHHLIAHAHVSCVAITQARAPESGWDFQNAGQGQPGGRQKVIRHRTEVSSSVWAKYQIKPMCLEGMDQAILLSLSRVKEVIFNREVIIRHNEGTE